MQELFRSLDVVPPLVRRDTECGLSAPTLAAEAIAAYRDRRRDGALPDDSVWSIHAAEAHRGLLAHVAQPDPGKLAAFLATLHERATLVGYDQHGRTTRNLNANPQARTAQARRVYATLLQLAAALGVARHFNPEQPTEYGYLKDDAVAALTKDVARALELRGGFPDTGPGAWGIDTPLGLLSLRQAISLGYLRELRSFLANAGRSYAQIVEIGGGFGRVGFHGARDLDLAWTIIDLPAVSLTQFFLLRGNGVGATLWVPGAEARPGHVRLMNAFAPLDPAAFRDALFVNFDSFVEMGRDTQDAYFDLIRDAGGDLLSINHEAAKPMTRSGHVQNWDLARFAGWGYEPGPRQLFWERDGYVVQHFLRAS